MEKLALVLPETPPFVPRHFGRCAVIGNSGDLLQTSFGEEIDGYDAVVRENGAPIVVCNLPFLSYSPVFLTRVFHLIVCHCYATELYKICR